MTLPEHRSQRHADSLARDGIETLTWPLMRMVPLLAAAPDLRGVDALLVTSANAAVVFARLSPRRDLPVLCVGDTTAGAVRGLGFGEVRSASGTVEDLAALARSASHRHYLYLRGREVSADLARMIGRPRVREAIAYATEPAGPPPEAVRDALAAGRFAAISIWSARNAQVLAEAIDRNRDWSVSETDLIAISEKAAQPFGNAGFRRIVLATTPDTGGMLDAIRAAAVQ